MRTYIEYSGEAVLWADPDDPLMQLPGTNYFISFDEGSELYRYLLWLERGGVPSPFDPSRYPPPVFKPHTPVYEVYTPEQIVEMLTPEVREWYKDELPA